MKPNQDGKCEIHTEYLDDVGDCPSCESEKLEAPKMTPQNNNKPVTGEGNASKEVAKHTLKRARIWDAIERGESEYKARKRASAQEWDALERKGRTMTLINKLPAPDLQSELERVQAELKHWQEDHTRMSRLFAKTFKERDELLAALKGMMSAFACRADETVKIYGDNSLQSDVKRARAAIANCERGKQ